MVHIIAVIIANLLAEAKNGSFSSVNPKKISYNKIYQQQQEVGNGETRQIPGCVVWSAHPGDQNVARVPQN